MTSKKKARKIPAYQPARKAAKNGNDFFDQHAKAKEENRARVRAAMLKNPENVLLIDVDKAYQSDPLTCGYLEFPTPKALRKSHLNSPSLPILEAYYTARKNHFCAPESTNDP